MKSEMNQYDFNKLMEKYLAGECTPQEESFVVEWSQQFANLPSTNLNPKEEQEIKKRTWKQLEAVLPKQGIIRKIFFRSLAVAAVLGGLFIGIGYLLQEERQFNHPAIVEGSEQNDYVSFINTEQQVRSLYLFDGTVVELKPNSSLKYPSRFVGRQRNVYLTGEAFFNVKRDEKRPFFVHAGGLITEVLGTSFFVKSLSKSVEVAVVSGKVSVYENGSIKIKTQLILTPNQRVTYNLESRKLVPGIVEAPKIINPSPEQVQMIFDEVPLQKVVEQLEKNFGLSITVQNAKIRDCLFSGDLNDLPLMEQLDLICKAVNARYTTVGNSIVVVGGDSCQ